MNSMQQNSQQYPMLHQRPVEYMVRRHTDGALDGPYDQQTITNFVYNGTLSKYDSVWNENMPTWEMIGVLMERASGSNPAPVHAPVHTPTQTSKGSPIHIQTAMVVMALDGIWHVIEIPGYFAILPGLILSFTIGIIAYFVTKSIQMKTAGDTADEAHSKALTMAILCGVPFPFLGTAVGTYFLIWAGLKGSKTKSIATKLLSR